VSKPSGAGDDDFIFPFSPLLFPIREFDTFFLLASNLIAQLQLFLSINIIFRDHRIFVPSSSTFDAGCIKVE
jgi:hypothetical protein